jgi:UDPglucose 6-dehydrogenase
MEEGAQRLLTRSNITLVDEVTALAGNCDLIFVPIQTPHQPEYEGITPIPETRADFDYTYLVEGVKMLADAVAEVQKDVIVVIISTVLPGTMELEIKPILHPKMHLCYNPYFIAMGTTIPDYTHPEFVLLGCDDESPDVVAKVKEFYATIHTRPVYATNIASAELIKVAYNTFIGMKIVFANTIMEICHKTDADADSVIDALSMADERLISNKYMYGGMGDGGGCHPRDNIAMSWLAGELELSHDFFNDIMFAREDQTAWLCQLIVDEMDSDADNVYILGKAYKPGTNLTIGSPALLLQRLLEEDFFLKAIAWDPYIDPVDERPSGPGVYLVGTRHEAFKDLSFIEGATIIDPWRFVERIGPDCKLVRVGER